MRRVFRLALRLLNSVCRPVLPALRRRLVPELDYGRLSFSQEGEDIVLRSLFDSVSPVAKFYVDVGAYHPKRLSNTYLFYRQGWRGINIDAMPGSMRAFERARPRDINIEAAISQESQVLKYHMFKQQALNTLDDRVADYRYKDVGNPACQSLGTKNVKTCTLTQILDRWLPPNQRICFLNIDVEGLDLEVLRSLDFEKYTPQCILIETKPLVRDCGDSWGFEITNLLLDKGYCAIARTYRTSIFLFESC